MNTKKIHAKIDRFILRPTNWEEIVYILNFREKYGRRSKLTERDFGIRVRKSLGYSPKTSWHDCLETVLRRYYSLVEEGTN